MAGLVVRPGGGAAEYRDVLVVQVIGAVGGVGASTFAWCLARALRSYAFDFSTRPGGLAWVAGAAENSGSSWPEFTGSTILATEWLDRAATTDGVHWFSGGSPPPDPVAAELLAVATAERAVVVDGRLPSAAAPGGCKDRGSVRILCATNSVRVWESAADLAVDAYWVRLLPGGIPLAQLEAVSSAPVFAAKSEPAVSQAVELGLGVPRTSRISKECGLIAEWLRKQDG